MSTEIKQMPGKTVKFLKIDFLTVLFYKQNKDLNNLDKEKEPFCSLTIVLPIQVRTNLCQLMAKSLPSFYLHVTALLQLMDQGVLEAINRVYRKWILRDLVTQSSFTIQDFLKKIDMIKVVDTVASA